MTDITLALHRRSLLSAGGDRRRAWRILISWSLVALVHALFLMAMLAAEHQHPPLQKPIAETILTFTTLPRGVAPPIRIIRPDVPNPAPPVITTAPVIVKPPPDFITPESPADILKALGEALSCGASNFENLTQAERARCPHAPWVAERQPNGHLVLAAPPKQITQPHIVSGAEQMRHDMQTAPPCPIMLNTPCLDDVITGRGHVN